MAGARLAAFLPTFTREVLVAAQHAVIAVKRPHWILHTMQIRLSLSAAAIQGTFCLHTMDSILPYQQEEADQFLRQAESHLTSSATPMDFAAGWQHRLVPPQT